MKFLAALLFAASLFGCACQRPKVQTSKPATVSVLKVVPQKPQEKKAIKLLPLVASGSGKKHAVFVLRFNAHVDEESAEAVKVSLEKAAEIGVAAVVLEINTPGGSVDDGFEIAKAIEYSQIPVHCAVDGGAYSMGYYILQSCASRSISPRSQLMIHNAYWRVFTILAPGVSIDNWVSRLHATSEAMLYQFSFRTKVSIAEFRKRLDNEREWWVNAEEALKLGMVDRIETPQQMADRISSL